MTLVNRNFSHLILLEIKRKEFSILSVCIVLFLILFPWYVITKYGITRMLALTILGIILLLPKYYLLLAILFLLQLSIAYPYTKLFTIGTAEIQLLDILILIVVAKTVMTQLFYQKGRLNSRLWSQPFILFLFWGIIVQLNVLRLYDTDYFIQTTISFGKWGLHMLLVFAFAINIKSVQKFKTIYNLLLLLALGQAAFAVFQFLLAPRLGIGVGVVKLFTSHKYAKLYGSGVFHAVGFIGSGRTLAGLLNLFIFAWLAKTIKQNYPRRRIILLGGISATMISAIILTQSRGEIIAFVAGLIVFLLLVKERRKIVMLSISILVFYWLRHILLSRFLAEIAPAQGSGPTSYQLRIFAWTNYALPVIKKFPLTGIGWGGFVDVASHGVGSAHSQYFQLLTEVGIVGFVLFMIIIIASFLQAWKLLHTDSLPIFKDIAIAYIPALIAMLVSFINADILFPGGLSIFWVMVGLTSCAWNITQNNRKKHHMKEVQIR